jgi:hypothetical protein
MAVEVCYSPNGWTASGWIVCESALSSSSAPTCLKLFTRLSAGAIAKPERSQMMKPLNIDQTPLPHGGGEEPEIK